MGAMMIEIITLILTLPVAVQAILEIVDRFR